MLTIVDTFIQITIWLRWNINVHCLEITFNPGGRSTDREYILEQNFLQLNTEKTEMVVFGHKHHVSAHLEFMNKSSTNQARHLGGLK